MCPKEISHNLKAFAAPGILLFSRRVKNKAEAKKEILNHQMASRIHFVIYKNKIFRMSEIYGGF